ncbi:AraC family transcriptional regulator [Paenibacillus sp. N1-5-1-14]|uniref:AraC family transcriptional regulator n=1 Tax=Paenibacillus radicibacter TaxID=2972488 RepID=UPI002159A84B|nr:AraC family transcriptional regulator [Paenibacillus radicibacter]MCR8641135.1 AraC family transcriptional regulator [Paenibacillus radicibacter]
MYQKYFKNYFKSKLFLKYILLNLLILLIPLVLITSFIYESAVTSLRSEIEQSHLNQLNQTKFIIDARMKDMIEIASRISIDERLTSYRIHHPYFSKEAIEALGQYKSTNSMIGELFLYFHNNNRIFSASGMSDMDVFNSHYKFTNWNSNTILQDLNSVTIPTMRPANTIIQNTHIEKSMLTYLVPIAPTGHPIGTIMYLINETELTGLIDSILGHYRGTTYILDFSGQVLASNHQGGKLSSSDAKYLSELSAGIHSTTIDGQDHSIVSVKSEKNGWTYVTMMPSNQFFSSVLHIQDFIIMLFSIVVLLGAVVAFFIARKQFKPISTLAQLANAKADSTSAATKPLSIGNEFARIHQALQDYSSRIDIQEPYARNHLLSLLLKYGDKQGLTPDLLQAFDIRFDHSHHFVMVIGYHPNGQIGGIQNIMQAMMRMDYPELQAHAYGVELPQLDQLALMVSFDLMEQDQVFEQITLIVEATSSNILKMFKIIPTIGVGTCYLSSNQMNESYIEACSAFELRSTSEQGTVTYFELLLPHDAPHTEWIGNNVLLKLSQSLKQGSYEVASEIIHESIQHLRTSNLTPVMIRCIAIDLMNTMLKTASELDIHNVIQDVNSNMNITIAMLDELETNYLHIASRICVQVEHIQEKEEHSLMDQVVAYIDQNYTDHALSLESISYEFAISASHISRSFKDKVGINFVQYIWQKRMEQVMHLLVTTDEPLKDIIQRVGYLDTPNFIRKFKKETGSTPGQYRKLHAPTSESQSSEL